MRFNDRASALLDIPDLPLEAFKHCGDRKIKPQGGGGGSSTPSKTTQTQVADLPSWAKPSAQQLLAKSEALTDIGQNPYQAYQGERTAQFSPLQNMAYQGAQNMSAGPQAFNQQVGQYMSPYMQNVINSEKLEAYRASQMLGQQQQAQATQAGAFGGYREAIQRAERERGLGMQLQDIQTKGMQAAYDRASDQFRAGLTQDMALNQMRGQLGTQQQQQAQSILDTQYQDFLNQQRYPYQQLEFMSNILRGTPMGTINTMYAQTPQASPLSQLVGAGTAMYGATKMMGAKEGGIMRAEEPPKKKGKKKAAGLAELALTKI